MDYWKIHDLCKEDRIKSRLIKHSTIEEIVNEYLGKYIVDEIGKSVEGKSIYKISMGNGPRNILLWSQMHGNEATATASIFDLFNFFTKDDDYPIINRIKESFTLHFIPMLNPDGASYWTRVNALGIDLNRDAVKRQARESKILWTQLKDLKPYLSFNLHDQRNIFNVGESSKTASISFLSASFNQERELNANRRFQMWLIGEMTTELSKHIPGHIGRYTDEFYPNATGDILQKNGFNNVLIESGTYKDDPERFIARKGNFVSILKALELIIDENKVEYKEDKYFQIPNNSQKLYDLLIKNVRISKNTNESIVDLGIMYNEAPDSSYNFMEKHSKIVNIGDLSNFFGIEEVDAKESLFSCKGKNYPILNQNASFEINSLIIDNGNII